jgi:hypothetical protein
MSNQQSTSSSLPTEDIEALSASLRGELVLPDSDGYDAARLIWNGMFDKRPALIARCGGTADVIAAVDFAREHDLVTAVRSGGHNSGGSGSCDGGILIDLSDMNAVHVDAKARRARVQGGATWGDFDREAQVHGLATPGGLVSATGVAGLSLAGGVGWLRGKYGLSLDNIVSVDIVTADGVLRTASEDENAELFWGVRGGGGNFGVITSFEFQVHPIGPTVMFVAPIYRAADAARVMKGWRDFMASAPDEIGGMLAEFSTIAEDPEYPEESWGEKVMMLAGVWAGPADEGEAAVQPLRELAEPLLDFSDQMPYCDVQQLFDALFPKGVHRGYFKSIYLGELDDAIIDEIAPRAADRPSDLPARHGLDAEHRRHLGERGRRRDEPRLGAPVLGRHEAPLERPRLSQLRRPRRGGRGARSHQLWRRQLRAPTRTSNRAQNRASAKGVL